jgi:membrane protein DedA with SNARE-associated domain
VSGLVAAIAEQGQRLVFFNVLLQQIGVPVPAEPTLIVAGSLAGRGGLSLSGITLAALVATLLADLAWFLIGKRYGMRALRRLYRLSSSPERKQSQTERLLSRWGPAAFAFAKFIPGLPMSGPILAGSMGTTLPVFLVCDLLAMSLWAGGFTALGMVFRHDVERVLRVLDRLGGWALLAAALVLAILVTWRLCRSLRRRELV